MVPAVQAYHLKQLGISRSGKGRVGHDDLASPLAVAQVLPALRSFVQGNSICVDDEGLDVEAESEVLVSPDILYVIGKGGSLTDPVGLQKIVDDLHVLLGHGHDNVTLGSSGLCLDTGNDLPGTQADLLHIDVPMLGLEGPDQVFPHLNGTGIVDHQLSICRDEHCAQ